MQNDWQKIESAPRDKPILGYGEIVGEIAGKMGVDIQIIQHSDYRDGEWTCTGGDYYATWMNPTHWMPLPPPPVGEERS